MKKEFLIFLILVTWSFWKGNSQNMLTEHDQTQLLNTPVLMVPPSVLNTPIPYAVNNANSYFMPYVFYQEDYSCAQASSLVYLFTYELAVRRNRYVLFDNPYHKFHIPSHFAWNFYNEANSFQGVSFMDTWHLIKTAGSPFTPDWGDSYAGGATKWMSGYSKYYEGMKNRIVEMYAIPTHTEAGINTLRHWIANHCSDDPQGGCANIFISNNIPYHTLPSGTEEAGKHIYTGLYTPTHSVTIVGYNDSMRFDFNTDGQYTNHIDINGDGLVTVSDWEIGGVLIVNSHGETFCDNGFAYIPYRMLTQSSNNNGIWNACTYVVQVRDEVFPQITYKATVSHDRRNMIKISAGISSNISATQPDQTIDFGVFNYQGGPYYMRGAAYDGYQTLELGLDVTPLLNYMNPDQPYKFFFIVDEKDSAGLGTGRVVNFSLMDYTSGTAVETPSSQTNVNLINNSTTQLSVVKSIHFSKPVITKSFVNTTLNTPLNYPLTATQGKPPYRWELSNEYTLEEFNTSFPLPAGSTVTLTNTDGGIALIDLPFQFPFFESKYDQICIYANGFITFKVEYLNWPYLCSVENQNRSTRMMAPFLSDLVVSSIKMESDPNFVLLHVVGKIKNELNNSVRFAVKLFKSGVIEFYYGEMLYLSTAFESVISRGDDRIYQETPVSGISAPLCSNRNFRFTPPERIEGLYITRSGVLKGEINTPYYNVPFKVTCYDNNEVKTSKILYFTCTPVGIESFVSEESFKLYPNPTTGTFRVEHVDPNFPIETIEIYDFQGKFISTFETKSESEVFNIGHFPGGTYLVKVYSHDKVNWQKITKL